MAKEEDQMNTECTEKCIYKWVLQKSKCKFPFL